MKQLIMIFAVILLISSICKGQSRPLVVDNRQYYPPPRGQQTQGNCTHFALIYYLKSALWNKKFDRDPNLEENQFSHTFVWNQNIIPFFDASSINYATYFMQNQGCATVADFAIDETSATVMPEGEAREKALAYKTKNRVGRYYSPGGYLNVPSVTREFINSLKDSLIKGNGFTIQFDIYPSFSKLEGDNNVYSCFNKPSSDSIQFLHEVSIIGYDDTIKTALGRGAFIAINSNLRLPYFYFDYNWFLVGELTTTANFLEEDFSSEPKAALHFSIENSLANEPFYVRDYIFIDTVVQYDNWQVDFLEYNDVLYRKNLAQIVSVNGRKVPLRSNHLLLPINSPYGDYNVVSDVTELLQGEEFESIEIIVFDPVKGAFINEAGGVIYSYEREGKMEVTSSYLSFIGTDVKAIGKVKDLPDTAIVFNDIRSRQLTNHMPYNQISDDDIKYGLFLKSSTSVLKRKLITISREDIKVNTAPQLLSNLDSVIIYQDSTFTHQFQVIDAENDTLSYRLFDLDESSNASIDTQSGLFSYFAEIPDGWYGDEYLRNFVVEVSDKAYTVRDTFSITVLRRPNEPPLFESEVDSIFYCYQDSTFFLDFLLFDPERKEVTVEILDDMGGKAGLLKDNINFFKYSLYFFADEVGTFTITLQYSDGFHVLTKDITIAVIPSTNINDRHKANFELVAYPNPVQDNVHFEFNLPQRGMITLEVYNLTGQLIETAVSDYFESGYNRATFNSSYLSPGTYLCRLRDENNTVQTIKIIKR